MFSRQIALLVVLSLGCGVMLSSAHGDIKPKDAVKYTNDLKNSKDKKVRIMALEELAKIGQIQKALIEEAIPYMMKSMEDKDPQVRGAAAKAVGMIDPDADDMVPKLMKMVKEDKDEEARIGAIQGLGEMGPKAKSAVKDLRELLPPKEKPKNKDKDKDTKDTSKEAKDKDKEKKPTPPPQPTKLQREVMQALRLINAR